MSHKVTVCITETLQRVIEVDVNKILDDPIDSIRTRYHDGEIVLDANDLVDTEFEVMRDRDK